MIHKAITFVMGELNDYLFLKTGESDLIALTKFHEINRTTGTDGLKQDQVGCSIVNML